MRNIIFSCLIATSSCNSVFYQGDSKSWYPPQDRNIHCDRVAFASLDQTKLSGMNCKASRPKGVIMQFHGNAQNMTAHYLYLAWMIPEGYSLSTFDYRGYGESEGASDREGIHVDARAYIRQTRTEFASEKRIYYGQSLGGAILMAALIDEGVRSDETYIFEGTFASYQRAARTVLARKWFLWPLQPLTYVLVTENLAPKNGLEIFRQQKVILIHGTHDPVVDFSHGQILSEKMQQPLWVIEGGKHLDSWFIEHGKLRQELLVRLATLATL